MATKMEKDDYSNANGRIDSHFGNALIQPYENCISPGGVYAGHEDSFVKNLADRIPLGRMAQVD
jgi:hypothetical protein